MPDNSEIIGKKTLYIQLFRIYEKELLSIFDHIYPFGKNNLKSYGNKIHELHLRICSEIENLAKEVCYTIIGRENVEKIMFDKRKEDFKQELLNINCEDDAVLEYILKTNEYSPFPHYLDFLDEYLSLCSKRIELIYGMENYDKHNYEYIPLFYRPFSRKEKGFVPERRSKYNKLKHEKLKNYNNCTLKDLINSFGGYFILLNYLYFGFNNYMECNGYLVDDVLQYIKGGSKIKSEIFIPSCAFISYPMNFLVNPNNQNINEKTVTKIDEVATQYTNNLTIANAGNKKLEHDIDYLYYCKMCLSPTIGVDNLNLNLSNQEAYKLKPYISFTNNKIENISTSKIGINTEEGTTAYDIEIGYPSDYWKTIIVVGDNKKTK